MAPASFGEYVKSAREAQGLSIRELTRRLEVEPTTVSRLENGTRTLPHPDFFIGLIFELDLDWRVALNLVPPYRRLWNGVIGLARIDYAENIKQLSIEES